MKQKEIKALNINELKEKLAEEKSLYNKLKLSHAVSPVENPMKIKSSRKTIARLETAIKSTQTSDK